MKKILILIIAMIFTVNISFAQYGPTKFTDNVSVEVKGGVSTQLTDLYSGVSPVVGVQVEKYVTPWLGFAVDANTLIANPYGSNNPHTMFDVVNVNMLTKVNLLNTFNYNGERKFFEPVLFGGIGWGHRTCEDFASTLEHGKNYMVSKAGVELNFILDKEQAWGARVSPAVVWGPVDCGRLDARNGGFEITAGVTYHFKNKDGNRHFTKVRLYDQDEVNSLNNEINRLKRENLNMHNTNDKMKRDMHRFRNHRPKVIVKTDTIMLMPDIQFEQGSKQLVPTSEATIIKMAEYMKSKPNKTFTLMGYASLEGSSKYNESLSLWRAETLRDKLVKYGVSEDNIKTVGYGETDKFSKEIRDLNRIVVIEE